MDDLIEQLERRMTTVQEFDCWEWVPDPLCQKAAAELRTLRAELALWKRLHAENCENYDRVCADREWFCKQAVDRKAAVQAERAAVVAWLHSECEIEWTTQYDIKLISTLANEIEAGEHTL